MSDIKFEIIKHIAILSTATGKWTKELNLVSWNDRNPKYDIREWSADHQMMGKGVTLTLQELMVLREALEKLTD